MDNYTIFQMLENPKIVRQARNFRTNAPKNSRSQIVFRTDIFRKLTLGAPDCCDVMLIFALYIPS